MREEAAGVNKGADDENRAPPGRAQAVPWRSWWQVPTYLVFVNRLKIFPQRCEILTNAHRVGVFSRHPAWREKHR